MFGERCCLCGGKLVNGRCRDCGLKNKRRMETSDSVSLGEDIRRQKKVSEQSAEKEKAGHSGTYQAVENVSEVKSNPAPVKNTAGRNRKKGRHIGVAIAIAIAIAGVLPQIFFSIREKTSVSESYEIEPYGNVTRALSETGEAFEVELEQGEYRIGVHIPEGNYRVTLVEGNGSLYLKDFMNSIFEVNFFDKEPDENEITEWDDARFYDGGTVLISGNVRVKLITENGQNSQMVSVENPLKDPFLLRKGEEMEAGKDFPAGAYDLHAVTGWTDVSYVIPLGTAHEEEEYNVRNESRWLFDDGLGAVYRNAVLIEGTTISSLDAEVELIPSGVSMVNYQSYYDNY